MSEDTSKAKTVTVRCKHPGGLILRVFTMEDYDVPTPAGVKTEKRAVMRGEPVRINGAGVPLMPNGQPKEIDYLIVGGFALTPNVDADFWNEWVRQNKDHPMVKNNLIAAHVSEDSARSESRKMKDLRSGLEPLVPDTDPRIPRRADGRSAVTTASRTAA